MSTLISNGMQDVSPLKSTLISLTFFCPVKPSPDVPDESLLNMDSDPVLAGIIP